MPIAKIQMYLKDHDDGPHKVFFLAKDMGSLIEHQLHQCCLVAPIPKDGNTGKESQGGQDKEGYQAYGYETEQKQENEL